MLNDETRRKLRLLNVGEFIEELEIQQQDPQTLALPFDERFQLLTDSVYQRKYNEKVKSLVRKAKLRLPKADIHDILYIDKRPLNRGIIADLASCRFVDECRSCRNTKLSYKNSLFFTRKFFIKTRFLYENSYNALMSLLSCAFHAV